MQKCTLLYCVFCYNSPINKRVKENKGPNWQAQTLKLHAIIGGCEKKEGDTQFF